MLALALRLAGGVDTETNVDADARLLSLAARKDQAAFNLLVRRHYQLVYRVVWRLMRGHADSEDIAQEAFLRLWKDPGQVRDAKDLRAWLIRVATNLAMDGFRKDRFAALDETTDVADERDGASTLMDRQRVSARVDRAIATLPDRQRLAMTLVQYEQLSNMEAALAMDVTVDAFESLIARARRSLKSELANEWEDMLDILAGGGAGER
jgi:RNA polymerase sigma-70 factor, ECF subfamily